MAKRGKNYKRVAENIETSKVYTLDEGVELALKGSYAKFDESVDIAIRLGVDPRHADQMVRSSVVLPNGTGKEIRVLVFAKGDKEKEALEAGADYAGGDEFVAASNKQLLASVRGPTHNFAAHHHDSCGGGAACF